MTEREKYLFDIQGYLVVKNFLSQEEVARLTEAFEANRDKQGEDGNSNTGKSTTLTGAKRGLFSGMLTRANVTAQRSVCWESNLICNDD